jgi:hypothetical protein
MKIKIEERIIQIEENISQEIAEKFHQEIKETVN